MNREIDNKCVECINEIHEYLDVFDEKYQRLQKDLFCYKLEKHKVVNEFDYRDLYQLTCEISNKIHSLKNEIRKILEKTLGKEKLKKIRKNIDAI